MSIQKEAWFKTAFDADLQRLEKEALQDPIKFQDYLRKISRLDQRPTLLPVPREWYKSLPEELLSLYRTDITLFNAGTLVDPTFEAEYYDDDDDDDDDDDGDDLFDPDVDDGSISFSLATKDISSSFEIPLKDVPYLTFLPELFARVPKGLPGYLRWSEGPPAIIIELNPSAEEEPGWLQRLFKLKAFDKEARGLSEDVKNNFYEVSLSIKAYLSDVSPEDYKVLRKLVSI